MTTFTEKAGAGSFILSEAAGQRSRENVTLLSGEVIVAGQVLAKLGSGKYVAYDEANGVSGSNAGSAISIYAVDATDGDTKIAAITNDAEVNGYQLAFSVGSPEGDPDVAAADLLTNSRIKVRWGSIDHDENLSGTSAG